MQDRQTATSFQENYTAMQTIYPGSFSTEKEKSPVYGQTGMNLSGNTADDAVKQQGAELKSTTKPKRKRILEAAGCNLGTVSGKDGPALQMKLGLSLTKYKMQKKFLRSTRV